ncbi:MAG: hypothetical protein V3S87_00290 [Alphaproteobacteria bacterium]
MIGRSLIVAAVWVAFSAPAYAFYCPKTAKAIDAALPKASLSADQSAQVKQLRDKGMAQHNSGDHKGGVISLAEAARIILNSM